MDERCPDDVHERFLCLIEIKRGYRIEDLSSVCNAILSAGIRITNERSVSQFRKQRTFGSRSVALDALAEACSDVAGEKCECAEYFIYFLVFFPYINYKNAYCGDTATEFEEHAEKVATTARDAFYEVVDESGFEEPEWQVYQIKG